MHEYAYYGRGNTIHSPGQIEWFQNTCDDKSFHVGGKQVITFLDGYATPLQCRTGIMYMNLLGKRTDADLNTFPHVLLTNGTHLSFITPTLPQLVTPPGPQIPPNTVHMTPGLMNLAILRGEFTTPSLISPGNSNLAQQKHAIKTQPIDFEKLRPYFGWVNKNTVEKTFHKTTQWAVASTRYPMRKHFKSRFSAFNLPRQSEEVATDTIFQIPLPLTLVLPWPIGTGCTRAKCPWMDSRSKDHDLPIQA